jgi:hypothetical protein
MDALLVILVPMAVFGLFAIAALLWGAESRPGFDGKPVRDDRPNWFPIPGSGHPAPASAPPPKPVPSVRPSPVGVRAATGAARQRPASATRAATNPSGV